MKRTSKRVKEMADMIRKSQKVKLGKGATTVVSNPTGRGKKRVVVNQGG